MPAAPAVLVCDSIGWRLDQLEAAMKRIRDALPAQVLAGVTLGYRQREDVAVVILSPGPSAGTRIGSIAVTEARLSGLRALNTAAAASDPAFVIERALKGCTTVIRGLGPAESVTKLREELGLGEKRGPSRIGAAIAVRWANVDGFLAAYTQDLSVGGVSVPMSGRKPDIGTDVGLELHVPGDPNPVRAVATVVHHGREGFDGFGGRIALSVAAKERLAEAVRKLKAAPRQDARRKDVRVPARLEVVFASAEEVVQEYTTNLSRGGAFVRTDKPPPMGETVELTLKLPDGDEVRLVGEVVRSVSAEQAKGRNEPPGCGLAFKDLAPDALEKLELFVATRTGRSRARVLLVDDAPAFRRTLRAALESRDAEVLEASSVAEAFERLLEELLDLDLLALELKLPDGDGRDLVDRIRQLGGESELAIAVVSSMVDGPAASKALIDRGVDDALAKSLGAPMLADRLLVLAEARRRARQG